jgi:hypothetical protein
MGLDGRWMGRRLRGRTSSVSARLLIWNLAAALKDSESGTPEGKGEGGEGKHWKTFIFGQEKETGSVVKAKVPALPCLACTWPGFIRCVSDDAG